MADEQSTLNIVVVWRGKRFDVKLNANSSVKNLGHALQVLTNVKPDTMRLLMPGYITKGSKLLLPFSGEHSNFSLHEFVIDERKPIKMMGALDEEVEGLSRISKKDMRIAGFDEEEKRLKQRLLNESQATMKLPQGPYTFCNFRTLHIPGIELNPPASEALKIMHMLACDPGITAVMHKHCWRVGVMTEMAPLGYVGISPKCILGFNKNHGEEISLRLRTDDLKGFRKYESIKRTLLHELAHMVHSEHDSNFHALDKQLNQEAVSLDWTKSTFHTLSGHTHADCEDYTVNIGTDKCAHKLGGKPLDLSFTARASSVAAAYHRLLKASSTDNLVGAQEQGEHMADTGKEAHHRSDHNIYEIYGRTRGSNSLEPNLEILSKRDVANEVCIEIEHPNICSHDKICAEPDPDDCVIDKRNLEPDLDDPQSEDAMESEPCLCDYRKCHDPEFFNEFSHDGCSSSNLIKPCQDYSQVVENAESVMNSKLGEWHVSEKCVKKETYAHDCRKMDGTLENGDHLMSGPNKMRAESIGLVKPVHADCTDESFAIKPDAEDPVYNWKDCEMQTTDPVTDDGKMGSMTATSNFSAKVTDCSPHVLEFDNQVLHRIELSVSDMSTRLLGIIDILKEEAKPSELDIVLQTLYTIIRNVIGHPGEKKFRMLRKANPSFQRKVANYKAAMEFLYMIGFCEDVASDDIGRLESFILLKRDDPGLLWLAKSCLEMHIV